MDKKHSGFLSLACMCIFVCVGAYRRAKPKEKTEEVPLLHEHLFRRQRGVAVGRVMGNSFWRQLLWEGNLVPNETVPVGEPIRSLRVQLSARIVLGRNDSRYGEFTFDEREHPAVETS